MSKVELLEQIIKDFDKDTLIQFYKLASDKFRPESKDFSENLPKDDKRFENIEQIGRIEHEKKAQSIAFFMSSVSGEISERDSKKKQYDIGKKILRDNYLDAGIFVFYGKNNFRLSLIAASYSGPKRKFTTFKRYTYFVSPELTNKTFKDQLEKCDFSSVEKILESFSIEAVNKDFYTRIALKFTGLTGGWRKVGSKKVEKEACMKLPDTIDEKVYKEFAVRLIGRLIFCWFLKKKTSKNNIPLIPEGILSSTAIKKNEIVGKYYHGVLEPLFFELLNTPQDKRKKEYKKEPWSLIPFLNGGLFTPHESDFYEISVDGKSKHINTLIIPDNWLKELLEIYERYNFTIDENTPVDIELSIEPEMLGRIFENLLAEINPETGKTARKSTGSYYTPRAIVEYMVDESLKQYLITKTGIKESDIVSLLSYAEDDSSKLKGDEAEAIIKALHDVRIIDPACGSGAFPIGTLQKILLILQKLDPDSKKWLERMLAKVPDPLLRKEWKKKTKLPNYLHKLGIIRDCIFGVDIQPIAVEISKLRCFLSLIVDEEVNDTKENRGIKHLPNLEFKFVCANSLIGLPAKEVTETKKSSSKYGPKEYKGQNLLYEAYDKINKLKELRDSYLCSFGQEKKQIEKQFRKLQSEMFKNTLGNLEDSQTALLSQWKPFEDTPCGWFDPDWMFGIKDGFDIVIANPPYISHDKIKKSEKKYFRTTYKSYESFADIYCFFIESAINLQNKNGTLAFITSNSYLRADYGSPIRSCISANNNIIRLINIDTSQIFESAIVNTAILVATKNKEDDCICWVVNSPMPNDKTDFNNFIREVGYKYKQCSFESKFWGLSKPEIQNILRKIESNGKTLEVAGAKIRLGLATGRNEAFIIDKNTRSRFIEKNKQNAKIIKPILRGRDINRYGYTFPDLYILLTKNGIDVKRDYPDIYRHLDSFGNSFKNRGAKGQHWTNLRACAFFDDFKKEKIIWIELTDEGRFALCKDGVYLLNSAYFMLPPKGLSSEYLLAILNSSVIQFYLGQIAETSGMGTTRWINNYVKEFPIPELSRTEQVPYINEVQKIIKITNENNNSYDIKLIERQIDEMVYELYGLADNEISIIKDLVNKK